MRTEPDHATCHDVIVLGAGASGLLCALRAARGGCRVLLLDHADRAGRKLAVTGGGRCNFTNRHISSGEYTGENPDFPRSALARFSPEQGIALIREAGIPFEEREHGQLFGTLPASRLVSYLVSQCREAGCLFRLGENIHQVENFADGSDGPSACGVGSREPRFRIRTSGGEYTAANVVMALGSPAWPQVGGSGYGYELARKFGHRIVPFRPALVGLVLPDNSVFSGLEGISLPVSVSLPIPMAASGGAAVSKDGKRKAGAGGQEAVSGRMTDHADVRVADSLALLFTHRGISGPAVLQASLYWHKGLPLVIDFLPGTRITELLNEAGAGKLLCRSLLKRHFPDRLAALLCPPEAADIKCASLSKKLRDAISGLVHAFYIQPVRTEGFAKAEVAAGGVSTDAVSSRTMESQRVPGLYFCGEVLDVTGRLGGYNLHWAFASGHAAGEALAEWRGKK